MYENEYPVRNFLLKLILVIIFVLLLLWLLPVPKFIQGDNNVSGSVVENKIFGANVNEMKDASISYFTDERLPQKEGETVRLTLRDMIDKKLLLPITDHKGNACDVEKSYVDATKYKDEYRFKINLKCGDKEDFVITHMGCYTYCKSNICEKEVKVVTQETVRSGGTTIIRKSIVKEPITIEQTVVGGPACKLYVKSGTKKSNNWYSSDVEISFLDKYTTTKGATIVEYGLSKGASPVYNKLNVLKVTNDGISKVYGYVRDSKGKTAICDIVVRKDTQVPDCEVQITSGVQDANQNYVGNVKVELTKGTDYQSGTAAFGLSESSNPTYNSQKSIIVNTFGNKTVYGYVKDVAGHTSVCKVNFNVARPTTTVVSKPSCELEITQGTMGNNGWYVSPVQVSFKSKKTTDGATIKRFGLGKTQTFNGYNTITGQEDGYYTVRGFVEDSNGYVATCAINFKKDATKPSCSLGVEAGNYNSGGYYTSNVKVGYKTRYDNLSGIDKYGLGKSENYNMDGSYYISTDGNHVVNGYVVDKAGNKNVCSVTIPKKGLSYEYKYYKEYQKEYSKWTDWQVGTYDPANPPQFGKWELKEVENLGYKLVKGYKEEVDKPIYRYVPKNYKTIYENSCAGFDIFRTVTNTTTIEHGGSSGSGGYWVEETVTEVTQNYVLETTTKTQTSYGIKQTVETTTHVPSTSGTAGDWKYVGLVSVTQSPTNTLNTKYVHVGMDFDRCNPNCSTQPATTWQKFERTTGGGTPSSTKADVATITRQVVEQNTYKTTSPGSSTKSELVSSKKISDNSTATYRDYSSSSTSGSKITVKCRVVRKPTQLFVNVKELAGFTTKRIPFERREYQYRFRTRKISQNAFVDYKWSYYNDYSLLNQGYTMTGEKRLIG